MWRWRQESFRWNCAKKPTPAAHKLAGVLGTFDLTRGTILAREAEMLYSGEADTNPEDAARLTVIAAQLRAIVGRQEITLG